MREEVLEFSKKRNTFKSNNSKCIVNRFTGLQTYRVSKLAIFC